MIETKLYKLYNEINVIDRAVIEALPEFSFGQTIHAQFRSQQMIYHRVEPVLKDLIIRTEQKLRNERLT
jgi:hypothetical protein